jgi:hypothetical protein
LTPRSRVGEDRGVGVLTTTHFSVRVGFYGLDEPDEVPFRATVGYDQAPIVSTEATEDVERVDRSALALLVPLTAARLLWNSRAHPGITQPMMDLLVEAAEELVEGEQVARDFRYRSLLGDPEEIRERMMAGLISTDEGGVKLGIPELYDSQPTAPEQSFKARLVENRRAKAYRWAKVSAPRRGPAFFAAFGLFALIEAIAQRESYEGVTIPAMAGILALGTGFEVGFGPSEFDRHAGLYSDLLVLDVVSRADPIGYVHEIINDLDDFAADEPEVD